MKSHKQKAVARSLYQMALFGNFSLTICKQGFCLMQIYIQSARYRYSPAVAGSL